MVSCVAVFVFIFVLNVLFEFGNIRIQMCCSNTECIIILALTQNQFAVLIGGPPAAAAPLLSDAVEKALAKLMLLGPRQNR
jgi:hypothetical protein